jgi:hypothetical protein
MAIAILEKLKAAVHELSHTKPEQLIKIYNELKLQKKMKTN